MKVRWYTVLRRFIPFCIISVAMALIIVMIYIGYGKTEMHHFIETNA